MLLLSPTAESRLVEVRVYVYSPGLKATGAVPNFKYRYHTKESSRIVVDHRWRGSDGASSSPDHNQRLLCKWSGSDYFQTQHFCPEVRQRAHYHILESLLAERSSVGRIARKFRSTELTSMDAKVKEWRRSYGDTRLEVARLPACRCSYRGMKLAFLDRMKAVTIETGSRKAHAPFFVCVELLSFPRPPFDGLQYNS